MRWRHRTWVSNWDWAGRRPWTYPAITTRSRNQSGKIFKTRLVQPEFRYWLCERFNGHFFGVHGLGGEYNIAKVKLPFGLAKNGQGLPLRRLLCRRGRELRLPMVLARKWEPGGHRRRRIRTVQLRQVSLLRLRPAARIRKQKLFRPDQSGH